MNLIRAILIGLAILLLAIGFRPYSGRSLPDLWRKQRMKRFEPDANRSTAYPLDHDDWLEFNIPRQSLALRVLTNAAVDDFSRPSTPREDPREGCRYALEYQLLDRDGQILDDRQYHLRASVLESRNADTGAMQSSSWFGNSDWIRVDTRNGHSCRVGNVGQ